MVAAYVSFALVLLAVGVALCGLVVYLLARSLAAPPRMTDGKAAWVLKRLSPGDLGLPFDEVSFDVRDAGDPAGAPLRIAAWWIPSPAADGRCAILLHGYADAKVGAIAWAPTWHALGWNVLALDLRAHGESGGRFCTGGFFEREDVSRVIDALRAQRPDHSRRLVLFGASFGAAVAAATAKLREDDGDAVDAVVLDSPVPDFAAAAGLQMERLAAPGGVLRRLAVRLAERMAGAGYADVRLLDVLPALKCPVLAIAPEHDGLLSPPGVRDALRAAVESPPAGATGPRVFWPVAGVNHLTALAADPEAYRKHVADFLGQLPSRGHLPLAVSVTASAEPRM